MMDESGLKKILNLFLDFSPEALNSFSPRSASFIIPVKREGFTDLFFRFLDSSNRNAEMF
jgi:hypothetical protein